MTADQREERAGAVFDALADPTRRRVLRAVAEQGPATATELALHLPVSRQAVAKHLGVLRGAGLVTHERAGREQRYTARGDPLFDAATWLTTTGTAWDRRLSLLEARSRDRR